MGPQVAARVLGVAAAIVSTLLAGCNAGDGSSHEGDGGEPPAAPSSAARAVVAEPIAANAAASVAPAVSTAPLPGRTDGCREGMVRVEGEYCPAVVEECLEEHDEYKNRGDRTVSERCLKYKEPSTCVSKERRHMSFCMDRYEWPNQVGEVPRVLTSWTQAVSECKSIGKRICTEDEFNFACEGPEMLPYVYGYERDAGVCTIDLPYVYPDHSRTMLHYESCLATPWCARPSSSGSTSESGLAKSRRAFLGRGSTTSTATSTSGSKSRIKGPRTAAGSRAVGGAPCAAAAGPPSRSTKRKTTDTRSASAAASTRRILEALALTLLGACANEGPVTVANAAPPASAAALRPAATSVDGASAAAIDGVAEAASAAAQGSAAPTVSAEVALVDPPDAGAASPCVDPEMALVGHTCVDKWEARLVAMLDGGWSPLPANERPPEDGDYKAVSEPGVLPQAYISRVEASRACKNAGKRLCSMTEFRRACQGQSGGHYPYGNKAKKGACNIGKPHLLALKFGADAHHWTYEHFNDPALDVEEGFLAKTGEYQGCESAAGTFDMSGNLHEWVSDTVDEAFVERLEADKVERKTQPSRTGDGVFVGGFFSTTDQHGPGCLFTTIAHEPSYHDYSIGFRCCADAHLDDEPAPKKEKPKRR